MTTLAGLSVSDAHVHFFSHAFYSALAKQKGTGVEETAALLGWNLPDPDPAVLASHWVAELDRSGVQRAAMIASIPGDEQSVLSAIHAFPDRFYGYFLCDPTALDALARVELAFEGGMKGLCLFPAMHRYDVAEDRVLALIEAAGRRPNSVVFVHCGVLSVGVRKKLGLASRFDMRFSNPVALHAVALQFPHQAFVIPHFGAGYLREALMVCDLCPNVYLDTSSTNNWTRYHVPEIGLAGVFRRALDVAGPKRLLFGSDSSFFPRGWNKEIFDRQLAVLQEVEVEPENIAAIMGGNLDRILTKT